MYKKIIFLCICIFLFTGCSDKYFICTINLENEDMNYSLDSKYKIYYNKNYVTKIEKEDIYKSEDSDIVIYFNDSKNLELSNSNDLYGGFNYNIDRTREEVKIKTIIDLSITDVRKMVNNSYLNEDYVVGNKLTTTGAKYFYKDRGAICE